MNRGSVDRHASTLEVSHEARGRGPQSRFLSYEMGKQERRRRLKVNETVIREAGKEVDGLFVRTAEEEEHD